MSGHSLSPCRENRSPGSGVAYVKERYRSPHRSPLRDPDGCSPAKSTPPALSENGRLKYPADWNVYRHGIAAEHGLVNGRLNAVNLNAKSWTDAENVDAHVAGHTRMWKASVPEHCTNRVDGVEVRAHKSSGVTPLSPSSRN